MESQPTRDTDAPHLKTVEGRHHRSAYISHIRVNGTAAPDSVVWNGKTYWTDGEYNPDQVKLRWLGVGKAGNEPINVFHVVGVNPNIEIDYILGKRLVIAKVTG